MQKYVQQNSKSHNQTWFQLIQKTMSFATGLMYKIGTWLVSISLSLGYFIVSNPRIARFFLIIVKRMIRVMCQKMAIAVGKATYQYRSTSQQIVQSATGVLTSDITQMAAEGMISTIFSGGGAVRLTKGLWGGLTTAIKDIPVLGSVIKGVEVVATELAEPFQEALKFGAELALYEQDLNKSFTSVLDILGMIVNPLNCLQNNKIVYTNHIELNNIKVDKLKPLQGGKTEIVNMKNMKQIILQLENTLGQKFLKIRKVYNKKLQLRKSYKKLKAVQI